VIANIQGAGLRLGRIHDESQMIIDDPALLKHRFAYPVSDNRLVTAEFPRNENVLDVFPEQVRPRRLKTFQVYEEVLSIVRPFRASVGGQALCRDALRCVMSRLFFSLRQQSSHSYTPTGAYWHLMHS
jgi:hypothetical protein